MDCQTARTGLWPPERPRLCGDDVVEARRHVDSCEECQGYFAQDRLLLDAYGRIQRTEAPRRAREAVFDALAKERRLRIAGLRAKVGGPRMWAIQLAAIAGLVGLAVTGARVARSPADSEIQSTPFIEDYLRRAVGEDQIVSSDPVEVAHFLTRELGVPLAPLEARELQVERAEICLLEGRRGAMIVYRVNGRVVNHYVLPRPEGEASSPARSSREAVGATGPGGPMVVTWASATLEQALVGELSESELIRLATASVTR